MTLTDTELSQIKLTSELKAMSMDDMTICELDILIKDCGYPLDYIEDKSILYSIFHALVVGMSKKGDSLRKMKSEYVPIANSLLNCLYVYAHPEILKKINIIN